MTRQVRLRIIFWGSLIVGVGLCIGGVFLPALLVPGGACLAGALAMYQSAYNKPNATNANATPTFTINIQNNGAMLFLYGSKKAALQLHSDNRPKPKTKLRLTAS